MNKNNQELYVSPQAEMIETLEQKVICESNLERATDEDAEWGWVTE